jgi:hypothetical protein
MLLPPTITHAQQGNLPVPMQKLPSYPPVVCVTPNWTSESCASRTPTYGPQNEPSGWQCGNVRIIVSTDSTTFFSTEFLITGIETRDNRFKLVKDELYLNGRLCTSFPERNKTESLPPYPPVTCLKPDGASEPCENRHASPTHGQNSGWAGWPPSPNATGAPPFTCMKSDGTPIHCATVYPSWGMCVKDDGTPDTLESCSDRYADLLPLLDRPGTYHEPGTYFPKFNQLDEFALTRWRDLPPEKYDHPYEGRLRIIEVRSMETVSYLCKRAVRHLAYVFIPKGAIGCAIPSDLVKLDPNADCVIFHAPESQLQRLGGTLNVLMRHELGHCNGWKNHDGMRSSERQWPLVTTP